MSPSPTTLHRKKYPERDDCRFLTRAFIEMGILVRGPCEMLGDDCKGRIEAHHDDYTKPKLVRWLCVHHHRKVDAWKPRGRPATLSPEQRRENHRLRVARYRARLKAASLLSRSQEQGR